MRAEVGPELFHGCRCVGMNIKAGPTVDDFLIVDICDADVEQSVVGS